MKQGNGSDLLGANDPRSASIGIIYVSPDDDRESVLAAILTQEKLGRKQIAIVLPNKNKAFQRPVDFDGLKNMRRKLQAQLVIVAPQDSGPADFARQRRFTYFISLESYARSLRAEEEASKAEREGRWPFGGRASKKPAAAAQGFEASNPSNLSHDDDAAQPAVEGTSKEESDRHADKAGALGTAAGVGAAAWAADSALHPPAQSDPPSPHMDNQDDWDEEAAFAMPAPPPPTGTQGQQEEGVPAPPPSRQDADDAAAEPGIITFPVSPRAKNTKKLPPENADIPEDESGAAAVPAARKQRSGKRPSAVAGVPVVVPPSPPSPPPPAMPGSGGTASQPPQRRPRNGWQYLLIALVVLLLFSLLLCGGIAIAAPATWHSFTSTVSNVLPGASPTATVTITPKSIIAHNKYVITGITSGQPDIAKRQVSARRLSFTTQPQSKTASATGFVNTPATHATGTLTFVNGSFAPYGVTAGTIFTDAHGVQIANDILAYIPAADPNTGFGRVTVPAHAVTPGSRGNIPAFDFSNMICCGNSSVEVSNTVAFTGGQDPQKYIAVQQSDIDNAAKALKQPLLQSALSSLNGLKHPNEQFVKTPTCATNVTSNHQAGDRATSVTVTVTATCSGEVYDQLSARTIAADLLKTETDKSNPGFALTGNILTTIIQATADKSGKVTIVVDAKGLWVYQFNNAQKSQLAALIVGKTQAQATAILAAQPGVGKIDGISISSGNTLPTDPSKITIVVQNVPGIQGTPTGATGAGNATPTNTLTSPVAKPSPNVTPGK